MWCLYTSIYKETKSACVHVHITRFQFYSTLWVSLLIPNCVVCWTKVKRNEKLNLTLNKNQGKRTATFKRMDFIVYLSKIWKWKLNFHLIGEYTHTHTVVEVQFYILNEAWLSSLHEDFTKYPEQGQHFVLVLFVIKSFCFSHWVPFVTHKHILFLYFSFILSILALCFTTCYSHMAILNTSSALLVITPIFSRLFINRFQNAVSRSDSGSRKKEMSFAIEIGYSLPFQNINSLLPMFVVFFFSLPPFATVVFMQLHLSGS